MWLFRFSPFSPNQSPQVAAAVVGGLGVAGAITSGVSSSKAAGQQAQAAQQAYQGEKDFQNTNTQNYSPYMTAGSTAAGQLNSDITNGTGFAAPFSLSNFMSSPGYQFQLQQGTQGVNNSAAATGGVLNGGTEKALAQYTQGLANQTYGDAYNRYLANSQNQYGQLAGIAGLGLNATSNLGAQNGAAQTQAGNFLTQKGNAQAAGTIGVGNAINSGLGALAGAYGTYQNNQSGYAAVNNIKALGAGQGLVSTIQTPSTGYIPYTPQQAFGQ